MKINKRKIEEMCSHISSRELMASKASRESIKYKQAEYLIDKIGQTFEGVVTGVTEWGLFVEIIENKCEGLIKFKSLEGKWSVDTENYLIKNGSETIRLGDELLIVVASVDLDEKKIEFTKF